MHPQAQPTEQSSDEQRGGVPTHFPQQQAQEHGDQECRGADTPEEFTRQRDKIISALATINADVAGLRNLGMGYVWALSSRLLPEWMEHVYELTSPRAPEPD